MESSTGYKYQKRPTPPASWKPFGKELRQHPIEHSLAEIRFHYSEPLEPDSGNARLSFLKGKRVGGKCLVKCAQHMVAQNRIPFIAVGSRRTMVPVSSTACYESVFTTIESRVAYLQHAGYPRAL